MVRPEKGDRIEVRLHDWDEWIIGTVWVPLSSQLTVCVSGKGTQFVFYKDEGLTWRHIQTS